MIRSLRTGISGLKSHQTRMDVVANNISNVNTIAFKRSRVAFVEVLGQQLLGVGRTAGGTGVNPSFVGQGLAVGSIDQSWAQGALETTSRPTDLALNGDGYFTLKGLNGNLFSRAGNFTFNADGELVTTTSGLKVQAFEVAQDGTVDTSQLSDVAIDFAAQAPPKFTENIGLGGNLSSAAEPGTEVTLSTVIYDEQGSPKNVVMVFTKSETANEWDYTVRNKTAEGEDPAFAEESGTVVFNTDGSLASDPTTTLTWEDDFVTGGPDISIDLSDLTQYGSSTTQTIRNQDGYASGKLLSFAINPTGEVILNFSNGQQQTIFQLAISNVDNANGLEQLGENFYAQTGASGDSVIGRAGKEIETAVVSGALETSNVDLANEFSDMIVSQRGYQASARLITTSDEILQETVQLKR